MNQLLNTPQHMSCSLCGLTAVSWVVDLEEGIKVHDNHLFLCKICKPLYEARRSHELLTRMVERGWDKPAVRKVARRYRGGEERLKEYFAEVMETALFVFYDAAVTEPRPA